MSDRGLPSADSTNPEYSLADALADTLAAKMPLPLAQRLRIAADSTTRDAWLRDLLNEAAEALDG